MSEDDIIRINEERNARLFAPFNPVTGEGSIGERVRIEITDFPIRVQYIPKQMMSNSYVRRLVKAGSVVEFCKRYLHDEDGGKITRPDPYQIECVIKQMTRIRCRFDFPFWAVVYVMIKVKGGGADIHFSLNYPQRKLISTFEAMRVAGMPIRLILLKARQWGGSTATQIYMSWLQLVHQVGLNSLIVGHVKDASYEVKDMFDRMINSYPAEMLHELNEQYDPAERKIEGVGNSGNITRIIARNCKIKIGSYEKPESARGGDYNLVHCTEVGLWESTDKKTAAKVVRSACGGMAYKPYTMIVYESTANGTGNFFEKEYHDAKKNDSQYKALFIAWFEIELYRLEVKNKRAFAASLLKNKNNAYSPSNRSEPGRYLWYLWECGATLEAIAWYIEERKKYYDHGDMASEYPTDDDEAFTYSGCKVFDKILVEQLRGGCRPPRYVGDVYGNSDGGKKALLGLRFKEDSTGLLCVWEKPEIFTDIRITDRYLVVVDIGGRHAKADWSVIVVIDRLPLMDGGHPEVVAQWYGHIDMDLLAWKAMQISSWYDDALLVIESNTLETKDKERIVEGDQSEFILNQVKSVYPNLYARQQSEADIREGAPVKYGFHTNVSTKPMIISHLIKMVREKGWVERDEQCLDELLTYELKPNGAYGAIAGKHDDLLMTRAIGLWIAYNINVMPLPRQVTLHPNNDGLKGVASHVKNVTEAVM